MEQLMEQMLGLQRQNDALQQQIDYGMNDALRAQTERDQLAAEEAARRAELDRRRAEAAALRNTQIRSEGVIFDAGGQTGSPASDPERGPAVGDAAARAFVLDGAQPVQVATAEVIANPSNTVLQGTLIQASLETAIESTLPGQITAIVNYPVWSFDQSRVLIPEGSRLFGTYNSNVSLGQARILVGWSRIVTPEGQSVQLAAFGADDQGRSGVTGSVNSRFGLRFGTAALLSIIGAGPAIAASEASSETGSEIAEDVAGSFSQATDAVIGEFATLPPVISVQPGAAISVIVDRDLEFY
jgi:type IV secretion system protein VirB10